MTLRAALAVLATSVLMAAGAELRAQTADRALPTKIEQALIEHLCSKPLAIAADPDKHDACLRDKLDALRADFGRDLSRLPAGERQAIDSACAQIRVTQGTDGYLECLSSHLVAIQERRNRARAANAPAPVAESTAAPAIAIPASGSDAPAFPSRVWLVAAVVVVFAAAGGIVVVTRARRSRHVCRVCGTRLETTGDMCATCRHEAADTLRRAAADRQRVQDDQERQLRERDQDERRRVAREAEDARLRQQEEARRRDEEAQRLEEETRRREAQVVASQPVAVEGAAAVFDPYAILDVPRDATAEAIQAAYDQAKAKYDPDLVSGLGLEVQDHYKAKAEAVERAFKLLTAV